MAPGSGIGAAACNGGMMVVSNAGSLVGLLRDRIAQSPDQIAYRTYENERWVSYTWRAIGDQVTAIAAALAVEGLAVGTRIAICAHNTARWVACDVAALAQGLVVVPLFFNDRPENLAYCLQDAGVRLLFTDHSPPAEVVACSLDKIVGMTDVVGTESWSTWIAQGKGRTVTDRYHAVATIVYTSGTTGHPKGVVLTHANIRANVDGLMTAVPEIMRDHHRFLSFLPLSHMLERTVGEFIGIAIGAETVFARGVAELAADLLVAQPTILVSVPKIFERIYARIQAELAQKPVTAWLVGFAVRNHYQVHQRQATAICRFIDVFAEWWVLRRVRAVFGGFLRYVFLGGAAANPVHLLFFTGLGLHFIQGYGLTEAAPVLTVNYWRDRDLGSVGRVLPGVEIRVVEGELWARGPTIMQGYWQNPQATAAVLDRDGYLHTGDLGAVRNGLVYLTGRCKDIIVLSNGEKVSPVDMEQAILADPLFEQALIVGEGRPTLGLLAVSTVEDVRLLQERANQALHAFPGYARIHRVARVPGPWQIENGLLTPTLKVRRQAVEALYAPVIDAMYRS